jgi:hypothetical protein
MASLKDFCDAYDLTFTRTYRDVEGIPTEQGDMLPEVAMDGFLHICRRTGLWMPGRVRFGNLPGEITPGVDLEELTHPVLCTGSCYVRASQASSQWVEVEAAVLLDDWYDRDFPTITADQVRAYQADLEAADGPDQRQMIAERFLNQCCEPGAPRGAWAYTADVQLASVALVQASRKALGTLLDGVYTNYDVSMTRRTRRHVTDLLRSNGIPLQ